MYCLPPPTHTPPFSLTNPVLAERLEDVDTSAPEQVNSWFRRYAHCLNEMGELRHRFLVLYFCARHNRLVRQEDGMGSGVRKALPQKRCCDVTLFILAGGQGV